MKSFLVSLIVLIATSVSVNACMTLHEARRIHPTIYLSWKGEHCWYAPAHRSHRHHHAKAKENIPTPRERPLLVVTRETPVEAPTVVPEQAKTEAPIVVLKVAPILSYGPEERSDNWLDRWPNDVVPEEVREFSWRRWAWQGLAFFGCLFFGSFAIYYITGKRNVK